MKQLICLALALTLCLSAASVLAEEENVFLFEAEDTYVNEIVGGNFSSNPTGRNCVVKDDREMGASNGYYVGSLCNNGATVEFELYTTKDVSLKFYIPKIKNAEEKRFNFSPACSVCHSHCDRHPTL